MGVEAYMQQGALMGQHTCVEAYVQQGALAGQHRLTPAVGSAPSVTFSAVWPGGGVLRRYWVSKGERKGANPLSVSAGGKLGPTPRTVSIT